MSSFKDTYGPWALITGASAGIGAEFARRLASKGLNLVLVARRKGPMQTLAESLSYLYSVEVKVVPVDLTAPDMLPAIRRVTDALDIGLLVNNAGIMPVGRFLDGDLEGEMRQLDLNSRVPLVLTHHFGRTLVERGRGGIIFLASMMAFQGTPLASHYAATKAFNLVFAEGLRAELKAAGLDVLAVAPGFTATDLAGVLDFSNVPIRLLSADQVVRTALHALGRKAVVVPGGQNRVLVWMGKHLLPRWANTSIFGKIMRLVIRTPQHA